jgi:hypothetical protein
MFLVILQYLFQEPRGVHVPGDPGGARLHHGAQLYLHHQADTGDLCNMLATGTDNQQDL